MRGSRKFCQRGSNSDVFFLLLFFYLMRGGDQIPLKAGQHRLASETRIALKMAFCWQAHDGPTLIASLVFQGIWTSIALETLHFGDFSEGVCPPLDPRMMTM